MAEPTALDWLMTGEKSNPGAVDTDNLDDEIKVREAARSNATSMKWLFDGDNDAALASRALPDLIIPERHEGVLDTTWRFGADIGRGAVESVTQSIGGARDAVQEMMDLGDSFNNWAHENLGLSPFLDEDGNVLSPEQTRLILPDVHEPRSVTGGVIRNVSQFLMGFDSAAGGVAASFLEGFQWIGQCAGDCLPGMADDGAHFTADGSLDIEPFSLCAVVLDGGNLQMVKAFMGTRTLTDGSRPWAFGQMNPVTVMLFPESRIVAVHRLASIEGVKGTRELPELDKGTAAELLALIEPGAMVTQSINPMWRPMEVEEEAFGSPPLALVAGCLTA